MKKYIILFVLNLLMLPLFAQNKANSPAYSFNVTREIRPPLIHFVGEVEFDDPTQNNTINANETCYIIAKVTNTGKSTGMGLKIKTAITGSTTDIRVQKEIPIDNIEVGETVPIRIPVTGGMSVVDGSISIEFSVEEPNGYGTVTQSVLLATKSFVPPMVEVVDYSITSSDSKKQTILEKMREYLLVIMVQNTKNGTAEDVIVNVKFPDGIEANEEEMNRFGVLTAGEQKELHYTFYINQKYSSDEIPIEVAITEKYKKYSKNESIKLRLNQNTDIATTVFSPTNNTPVQEDIAIGRLHSIIDKNIPQGKPNPNRYAIIFGNEDYTSYQAGLTPAANVVFAKNDAAIFSEYCLKTLGISKENCFVFTNAISTQMKAEIKRVTDLVSLKGEKAELIFYYAGHGRPDEKTKEPYLIPVDVSANNLYDGIKLYDLYTQLASTGAGRITVFMDACFSGGGREAGLLADRAGIGIVPKKELLNGNLVVFAATQSDEVALPFNSEKHGIFTFYLLEKLQQNSQCTYEELFNYLEEKVPDCSTRQHNRQQHPEMNVAPDVLNSWKGWKFN
ncbi:MAG: caspase family protein [Bacteroidales bacterium]|nr:caspase family protein [Bacteroidales bacterium]